MTGKVSNTIARNPITIVGVIVVVSVLAIVIVTVYSDAEAPVIATIVGFAGAAVTVVQALSGVRSEIQKMHVQINSNLERALTRSHDAGVAEGIEKARLETGPEKRA